MQWILWLTFTVGQLIHTWGKMIACTLNKTAPPRTWKEYLQMRGQELLAEYFCVLMVVVIVWVGSESLPQWVQTLPKEAKIAICGLLGYNGGSVMDKLKAVVQHLKETL